MANACVCSMQPRAREEYVPHMGGMDDQRLSANAHVHKPMAYFSRRLLDQAFSQAVSNAYLLFAAWAEILFTHCTAALESATEDRAQEGEGGAVVDECVLTAPELKEFQALLKKALKMGRVQRDQSLANKLMSLRAVGQTNKGARRKAEVVHRTWSMAHVLPRYVMGDMRKENRWH